MPRTVAVCLTLARVHGKSGLCFPPSLVFAVVTVAVVKVSRGGGG